MKRLAVMILGLAAALLTGCTENKITITNEAAFGVHFLFLGEKHYLPGETGSLVLSDLPNGRFQYSTTYSYPSSVKKVKADDALAGELEFTRDRTEYVMMYSSVFLPEDTSYTIYLNIVRSDRLNSVVAAP
jgi:hypothetical protein